MPKLDFLVRLLPTIRRLRMCAILGAVLLASIAWSGDAAYFPLDVGNLWVYETGGTRCCTPAIIEVVDSADFNDTTYFLLRGFPRVSRGLLGPHQRRRITGGLRFRSEPREPLVRL